MLLRQSQRIYRHRVIVLMLVILLSSRARAATLPARSAADRVRRRSARAAARPCCRARRPCVRAALRRRRDRCSAFSDSVVRARWSAARAAAARRQRQRRRSCGRPAPPAPGARAAPARRRRGISLVRRTFSVRRRASSRKWRNWQTHQLEGLAVAIPWGFESPLPHQQFTDIPGAHKLVALDCFGDHLSENVPAVSMLSLTPE